MLIARLQSASASLRMSAPTSSSNSFRLSPASTSTRSLPVWTICSCSVGLGLSVVCDGVHLHSLMLSMWSLSQMPHRTPAYAHFGRASSLHLFTVFTTPRQSPTRIVGLEIVWIAATAPTCSDAWGVCGKFCHTGPEIRACFWPLASRKATAHAALLSS